MLVSSRTTELGLLSSYDTNPATPVWTGYPGGSDAGARDTDTYLSIELVKTGAGTAESVLYKRTSSSATPDWTFAFVPQFYWLTNAGISRDGRVIVTGFFDEIRQRGRIRLHDPATGIPTRNFDLPSPIAPAWLALSPDGTVAAVTHSKTSNVTTHVVDLATESILFSAPGWLPARQGLSEGGRVLLVEEIAGSEAHVRAFVRDGRGYREGLDATVPYVGFPHPYAVSDDGSTVALAWYEFTSPGSFTVRAYDVTTGTKTMERVLRVADVSDYRCDLAIDADGSRFVVGTFGAERALALYSRDEIEPLVEYPGDAVTSVDISPDGKRFVASRYPSGGLSRSTVEMYEAGGEDLVVRGRPSIGSSIRFELHATPGADAFLLYSPRLAATPLDIRGVGTLVLLPSQMYRWRLGAVPPSGVATATLALANDPALVGQTTWFQGLSTGPRKLSRDWIQLTILP